MADKIMPELIPTQIISNICQCALCLETYHDPKSLPCRHSFCSECLHNLVKFTLHGTTIKCPTCQKEHRFPKDTTVSNMDTELILIQLLDTLKSLPANPLDTPLLCCYTEDCERASSSLCLECYSQLCRNCDLMHDSCTNKVGIKESKISGTEKFYCKTHDCFVNKFCCDCRRYLCMYCTEWELDCKRHNMILIEESKARCREELKAYEKTLEKLIPLTQNNYAEIVCCQEEKLTKMENEICALAEKLKKSLEERVDSLKEEYIQDLRKSVEVYCEYAQETMEDLKQLKRDIVELSTNLTYAELACKTGYIGERLLAIDTSLLHKECNFTVDICDCYPVVRNSLDLASFFGNINISLNSSLWERIKPESNDVSYIDMPNCMVQKNVDTVLLYLDFPINRITGKCRRSDSTESQIDIFWHFKVKKSKDFLCVIVKADLMDYKWCEASLEFIARNFPGEDKIKTNIGLFTVESPVYCLDNFMPLQDLTKENGFVINGKVRIGVLVTIKSYEKKTRSS